MLQLSPAQVPRGLYSAEAVNLPFAGALGAQPNWKCRKPRLQQVVRGSESLQAEEKPTNKSSFNNLPSQLAGGWVFGSAVAESREASRLGPQELPCSPTSSFTHLPIATTCHTATDRVHFCSFPVTHRHPGKTACNKTAPAWGRGRNIDRNEETPKRCFPAPLPQ